MLEIINRRKILFQTDTLYMFAPKVVFFKLFYSKVQAVINQFLEQREIKNQTSAGFYYINVILKITVI